LEAELEQEVAGLEFDLTFDPLQFKVEEISSTSRTENLGLFHNVQPGKMRIGMVDIYGANTVTSGEGSLLKIRFQKKRAETGISSVRIEKAIVVNTMAEELQVQIRPNKITKSIPQVFTLAQNYPNPFNPNTTIQYTLPQHAWVKINIYNILGRKVKNLVDEYQPAGYKKIIWDGKNDKGEEVASGIYFYRIQAKDFTQVKKMVLLK